MRLFANKILLKRAATQLPPWHQMPEAKNKVDMLPISWVENFKRPQQQGKHNNPVHDIAHPYYQKLAKDIATNGIQEPLQIGFNPEIGKASLEEGHHRLEYAKRAGHTHVPVMCYQDLRAYKGDSQSGVPFNTNRVKSLTDENGHFPATAAPRYVFDEFKHLKGPDVPGTVRPTGPENHPYGKPPNSL